MPRATTALVVFDIPGRERGGVRILRPAAGKSSYRVLWTEEDGTCRERTRTNRELAEATAESVAVGLAAAVQVLPGSNPTLGDLLDYHLHGAGRPNRWTSEKSARRPAQIARRIFSEVDLARPAHDYLVPEGRLLLQDILNRAALAGCIPGGAEYEKAGALMKRLFDVAANDGLLALPAGNPMSGMRYRLQEYNADPSPQLLTVNYIGPELRPPTERVLEFIDAAERRFGAREGRYVEVLAFGGLRPGEANGLSGAQLRTDHPGILVNRQLLELTAAEARAAGGESQQFRPPKWGHLRNAAYPAPLLMKLREFAETNPSGPKGVLFPNMSCAGFRRQGNWRRDVFHPIAEYVGWPTQNVSIRGREETHWVWPVYAFRHHYANFLLKDLDVPLVKVARSMGHKDARITERMYLKTELDDLDSISSAYDTHLLGRSA
jgi:integrase